MASLLYGLAGKLAGELCSPLFKDYVGKPWELGTKSEFEKIKSSVSAIEAVLLDAEEKQRTNRQVRDWLKKIKLVFYDLEDLLQEVHTEDLKRQVKTKNKKAKKVRIFFSSSNQLKFRFKMGRKVKLIRETLDAIASDRNSFGFAFTERKEEIVRRREETHSFVPVDQFIGRQADKERVTNYLLQPDKVSVISIIGIGGIGKTTLAQSIYDSEEVNRIFDLRMWVCVSVPFDVKLICRNIIESATGSKCDRLQMNGVKDELKKAIDGRKYLLVLDDVWNESHFEWRNLEVLLACGAEGSKILITARAELVARASSSIQTHVLKGLSDDQSWALFKKIAFNRGVEQVNPTMERIGKAVVEKCAGVPLVVKAIGSMLAVKKGETDWLDFEKNDLPRVAQDSEGKVLPILRLSYDNLSAPLKRCFVFCAIYPKDHRIRSKELIGMWMAHGFIQLDGTPRSLEDVGQQHFKDLLDRSFFEVDERGDYKMHDLIHDLAQSVGGDEYYSLESGANSTVKSTRHTWVSGDKLTNICCDATNLHTLVISYSKWGEEEDFSELTSKFEQLRLLRLRQLWLTSVPQFVGGLRHLYYLDLSRNYFVSLPESICSLYNLQTLILCECEELEELPAGTRDLVNLRRLDVSGCEKLRYMPRGLEELTCLQTLILSGCRELEELPAGIRDLVSLRCLDVSGCEKLRYMPRGLEKLTCLQTLILSGCRELEELPAGIRDLVSLRCLDVSGCAKLRYMPRGLEELTCLQTLILSGCRELEELPAGIRDLVSLRCLDVSGCEKLRYMPRGLEELTCLQTLILSGCRELEELPAGIRYLVSLRCLDVSGCDELRYMPRGVEELTCLQTLNTFVAGGKREEGGKRKWAELSELKSLVNLRGSLAITKLRGSKCERNKSCILMELKLVQQLELKWKPIWIDVEDGVEEEEEFLVIESLKPHPNLERLIIEGYPGSKYPSWMDRVNIGDSLPNIVYIKLDYCVSLRHLPALGLLPCLQQLHLDWIVSVEYLIDRSSLEEEADQILFPSLKDLNLGHMRELKSVVEPTEASQTAAANYSRYFPALEKLQINYCPLFNYLSNEHGKLFVSLLELCFSDFNTETLPSWVQYLPHLQTLTLDHCSNIASLPEWMGNLTSLQELHLEHLHSLASIPDCMQRLTSLQRLVIEKCPDDLMSRCKKETGVDWNKIAHIPYITVW